MKKISIIIPVYNGSQYISRCMDSVINQKDFLLDEIEIIAINDGSKDQSLRTIQKYEEKYPDSIRCINQENQGVAKTRNKGIRIASAPYIMFMDQDDYIAPDFCQVLYQAAEAGRYDYVVGGYQRPNSAGKIIRKVSQQNTEYSKKYKISAAWGKIHRTEFLKKHKIRFYDNNYGEDIIFTMKENQAAQSSLGVNYIGYNWFWNEDSVSNTKQRGLRDDIKILPLLAKMIPYAKDEMDTYYIIQTAVHYLLFSGRRASSTSFYKLYTRIFDLFNSEQLEYKKNRYIWRGPSGALFSTKIAISGFMLLHRLNLIGLFAKMYCNGK